MTSFQFTESSYRFTNPIRFFKANDPIYYEVDNIPLKQLQENDLWLKDQIFNLKLTTEGGVERQNINELRPYVTGSDNVVRVKPGRFTARINDAYGLTPLQILSRLLGDGITEFNAWSADSLNSTDLQNIISKFKENVQINLNGLTERAFAKLAYIPDVAEFQATDDTQPSLFWLAGVDQDYGQPPFPGIGQSLWNSFQSVGTPGNIPDGVRSSYANQFVIRQYDNNNPIIGFARLGAAETTFIKKWRGVARTSVVDIPQEISIAIPAFNEEDHFYYDENGVKTYTNATQRIDLVFIYSKPVDTSSVTINKFVANTQTTITEPTLGIVYGAGVGVNFKSFGASRKIETLSPNGAAKLANNQDTDDSTLADGTVKMLSHFGDESGTNTGFYVSALGTTIRGSFPSPDDLMNISPLLDEELASSSLALIGQTVLPVAYVVVKKNATLNLDQVPILNTTDLVDIRPFFRTTELSYNERAGLAAAIPAPSLANPVVTQAELDYEMKRMFTDIVARIPPPVVNTGGNTGGGDGGGAGGGSTGGGTTTTVAIPRIVGGGTIYGGYNFGVEGAIASYINTVTPGQSRDQIKNILANNYGYGAGAAIPDYPSWEIAKWVQQRSYPGIGEYPNDRVNLLALYKVAQTGPGGINETWGTPFGCNADANLSSKITFPSLTNYQNQEDQTYGADGNYNNTAWPVANIVFCKKTINIDREVVSWMADYSVNVNFLNCVPISGGRQASPIGIWIDKRATYFTIYVAWNARENFIGRSEGAGANRQEENLATLRSGNDFAGFMVINKEIENYQIPKNNNSRVTTRTGESGAGVCIYPTVKFEITGIPSGYIDPSRTFTEENATIRLI